MNIRVSYNRDFVNLLNRIKEIYGDYIFDLEGIGKQLDLNEFSKNFFKSSTVADASVDANANVDNLSIVAYENEMPKSYFRLNSLYLLWKHGKKIFGQTIADKIIESEIIGDIYINDLSNISKPYCYNFSTYDVMIKGLPFVNKVKSEPPKHLSSFIGQLVHFTSYASNQVMGAVGLADLLIVVSYYVDKLFEEWKEINKDYLWKQVKQELQEFIFSCNQPFRGGLQSGFYNVSIYDTYFLEDLCQGYIFPDGSTPNINTIKKLQEIYLDLMNETLEKTPATFPVTTACFSIDENNNIKDEEFLKFIAEKNKKFGFINIYAGKSSTLSSCCRLRSDMSNEYFNSFGSGSTKIGSFGVVTLNIPRLAYKSGGDKEKLLNSLKELVDLAIKINYIKRYILQKRIETGCLPLYDFRFMDINTQYSTIGVVGLNEVCEIFGLDILDKDGQDLVFDILKLISNMTSKATKELNYPHNMEQVPAENSAIKLATKDIYLQIQEDYEFYSNQFIPLIKNADLLDRIKLQGMFDSMMSGGAIAHLNVETTIEDTKQIEDLIKTAVKMGVVYHAINYNIQKCKNGHMTVGKSNTCPLCKAEITDNFTRVVGFLVNTKNFHKTRREKDYPNRQFYKELKI